MNKWYRLISELINQFRTVLLSLVVVLLLLLLITTIAVKVKQFIEKWKENKK